MKKFFNIRIIFIIVLILILTIMIVFYLKDDEQSEFIYEDMNDFVSENINLSENKNVNESSSTKTIQSSTEVSSALSENIELHATYYLSECYVETNQKVKKGDNILKYTNGTYLTAPYDLVITELKIPEVEGKCTNDHYISVSSTNNLAVQIKISEEQLNQVSIGQEAKIKFSAFSDKEIIGYVTKVSSTASQGNFTVTIEFENDGNIMIGMTSTVEL